MNKILLPVDFTLLQWKQNLTVTDQQFSHGFWYINYGSYIKNIYKKCVTLTRIYLS